VNFTLQLAVRYLVWLFTRRPGPLGAVKRPPQPHSKSSLYGAFVWGCGGRLTAQNGGARPGRAVLSDGALQVNGVVMVEDLQVGLGRIVALYYRSSTAFQIC
jgi:hypothetical protein